MPELHKQFIATYVLWHKDRGLLNRVHPKYIAIANAMGALDD